MAGGGKGSGGGSNSKNWARALSNKVIALFLGGLVVIILWVLIAPFLSREEGGSEERGGSQVEEQAAQRLAPAAAGSIAAQGPSELLEVALPAAGESWATIKGRPTMTLCAVSLEGVRAQYQTLAGDWVDEAPKNIRRARYQSVDERTDRTFAYFFHPSPDCK